MDQPDLEGGQCGDDGAGNHVDPDCVGVLEAQTQGEPMTHSPAIRLSHSSHTANAASAATASTAMNRPMVVCAPADRPKSQGEKNRLLPNSRFATSQSLALDHRSMAGFSRAFRSLAGFGPLQRNLFL